jgi:hypothetical protein
VHACQPSLIRKERRTSLGSQPLEKGRRTLIFHELFDDLHTADLTLKVGVLDARFDGVEGGGDSYAVIV